jgi:uncharacterized protein YjbI with pentapeptide repeats
MTPNTKEHSLSAKLRERGRSIKQQLSDENLEQKWQLINNTIKGFKIVSSLLLALVIFGLSFLITRIIIHVPKWPKWTGFGTRTAWDLAELLLVPIVFAVGAYIFQKRQKNTEEKIAQDRAEQAVFQSYLDKMTELLLEHNLRDSSEEDEVQIVARATTLAALRDLNSERRRSVLQFLMEANLISGEIEEGQREQEGDYNGVLVNKPKLSLEGAKLQGTNLFEAKLRGATLVLADLSGADLNNADLSWANLSWANLSGAKLIFADLRGAYLRRAYLGGAKLTFADLRKADLRKADLRGADLSGADLSVADLREVTYDSHTQGFTPPKDAVKMN